MGNAAEGRTNFKDKNRRISGPNREKSKQSKDRQTKHTVTNKDKTPD